MLTVCCVRTGTRYGAEYVERLRNMIARHLSMPYRFVCLTDQPEELEGVENLPATLPGWWAKMELFALPGKRLYFDLDTVIVGDLTPLAALDVPFGICDNFTRAVMPDYPCKYGSCVMVMGNGFGRPVYDAFMANPQMGPYGDQKAIEELCPDAAILQDLLPAGYLVGRRAFTDSKPAGAAVMIFAGKHKPHNTPHRWLRDAWR